MKSMLRLSNRELEARKLVTFTSCYYAFSWMRVNKRFKVTPFYSDELAARSASRVEDQLNNRQAFIYAGLKY